MEILHSTILGSGQPLLILHGFLGMSDNWKTIGNQYAENNMEVHLIDQRNHGKSFHSKDFDYQFLAEDVKNYIFHHGLDEVFLLGHSMGGKTAMQFACYNNHLTKKLLVVDIAPKFYPPHHQYIIEALKKIDFSKVNSRSEADKILAEDLTEISIRQFLLKNLYWVEKGKLAFRFNFEVLQRKMAEIGDNIHSTDTYVGPSLFLRGDRSEYILENDFMWIKKHFPKATMETVSNSGHWLHAENPKEFFEKSLSFFKN